MDIRTYKSYEDKQNLIPLAWLAYPLPGSIFMCGMQFYKNIAVSAKSLHNLIASYLLDALIR